MSSCEAQEERERGGAGDPKEQEEFHAAVVSGERAGSKAFSGGTPAYVDGGEEAATAP